MYKKSALFFLLLLIIPAFILGQTTSRSFELRYFTSDPAANGETDFMGETEYFSTEQRVEFLNRYAAIASDFFNDPGFNTVVAPDEQVEEIMQGLKQQPQPEFRKRLTLDEWKWLGYRDGQHEEQVANLERWLRNDQLSVSNGYLEFLELADVEFLFRQQGWRYTATWEMRLDSAGSEARVLFSDKGKVIALQTGIDSEGNFFYTTANNVTVKSGFFTPGKWHRFRVEFDMAAFQRGRDYVRYNLYIDDDLVADYVPMQRSRTGVAYSPVLNSIAFVDQMNITGGPGLAVDNIWGVGYHPTGRKSYPYTIETFLDEDFKAKPDIRGWNAGKYDDAGWVTESLPIAHGSERHSREKIYLRKIIDAPDFNKAILHIETLSPGGKIWVNGEIAHVVNDRHPIKIDIAPYLNENSENLLAIEVDYFYLQEGAGEMMPHTSLDYNVGWFAGRMWLDFIDYTSIEDVFVYTSAIEQNRAVLNLNCNIKHSGYLSFRGEAEYRITPWYPQESEQVVAQGSFPVEIGHGQEIFREEIVIENPDLWWPDAPHLYKVQIILRDRLGDDNEIIDDFVVTTGVRTVDQEGGTFRLNGQVYMLNGSQIFGFRSPIEETMKWIFCPPAHWYVRELLQIKNMNGNMLRIHVHAYDHPSGNTNDPRLPEIADQMGVMLMWATPAWVRTGMGWGHIDWEGLPKYMRQVYNHPSIVLWEVANHTQSFRERDIRESELYMEKAYNTVSEVDLSRLISYNSFIRHFHYWNDEGTIDYAGNPIDTPSPYWTAPMVTRGNQDAITGYHNNWSRLRNWPDPYTQNFLDSRERAYFNFENEESIGQDNWELVKGKPWYRLHSYEWSYDEGTIGRRLSLDEWQESQAWQAFSSWESMKKQRQLGYDGFSWCNLHGGPNSVTYKKPLIDFQGHAKLAYWTKKMVFQRTVAGSADVNVVYGPDDLLTPVVIHWGAGQKADLTVIVKTLDNETVHQKIYEGINLPAGREAIVLEPFMPETEKDGYYVIEYILKM